MSPSPGSLSSVTRLVTLSHVTPLQLHGDGDEKFHRIVLPRTAELSLVKAAMSPAMSWENENSGRNRKHSNKMNEVKRFVGFI